MPNQIKHVMGGYEYFLTTICDPEQKSFNFIETLKRFFLIVLLVHDSENYKTFLHISK